MNGYYQNSQNLHVGRHQSAVPWWHETAATSSDSPVPVSSSSLSYSTTPVFQKQWCYVDRVGCQYVVINSFDNLPLPEKPPTDLSHYSHSPPNFTRYNADRRQQFADGLPKAIEKLQAYGREQEAIDLSMKWKRQRCL